MDKKIGEHTPRYGNSGYQRRDSDFYPTPSWVTDILLPHITPAWETQIWEPASGQGHILRALYDNKYQNLIDTDIIRENKNFLNLPSLFDDEETYKWIITNPPYSLAQEFVEHAINLTKRHDGKVAMLLNNNWDAAKGNSLFTSMPCFKKKIVITKRIRWIEGSTGAPRENHAWYIWDWINHYNGRTATIEYWRG